MLVLSLFPGLGLLDRAFEEEGFTVVRGPDVLWGADVRRFHPPAGRFEGVIGGPPCQPFSCLGQMFTRAEGRPRHVDLIPEFERCVAEAQPDWFLMEEVVKAPAPVVPGYVVRDTVVNNRWFGELQGAEQSRTRRLSFGTAEGHRLAFDVALWEAQTFEHAVTADPRPVIVKIGGSGKPKATLGKPRRTVADALRLQGLPEDFLDASPFTESAKRQLVGNGVPLPMGRAVARAVKRALHET
jgi:DNA (cytosine-5)-methyltransferase 1